METLQAFYTAQKTDGVKSWKCGKLDRVRERGGQAREEGELQ